MRNRYAVGAADILFAVPISLRCSMFSKGTSRIERPLGRKKRGTREEHEYLL